MMADLLAKMADDGWCCCGILGLALACRYPSLDKAVENARERIGRLGVDTRLHIDANHVYKDYHVSDYVLGRGLNGNVHLATSRKVPAGRFAVKTFHLNGTSQHDKRIMREVEICLSMDHPHIVRLVDVYRSKHRLDLVMECMDGGMLLSRVIERKHFCEYDAVVALWQMVLALNYLSTLSIVHRDIKPENFLYEAWDSERLKLIDFGFSTTWQPSTKMHSSCGTLQYIAPEVLQGGYTAQCDMWSLGVVAFILLTGKFPFGGDRGQQMRAIHAGRVSYGSPAWKEVSDRTQDFVDRLLQRDPDVRLTPLQALEHPCMAKREAAVLRRPDVDSDLVASLRQFAEASQFRRTVLYAMAWSMTSQERRLLDDAFLEADSDHSGTISLGEFKQLLQHHFELTDEVVQQAFDALDSNHSEQLEYSEFLAACASARISLHSNLLHSTLRRFDEHDSGIVTVERLQQIIGPDCCSLADAQKMILEADPNGCDGEIRSDVLAQYLRDCYDDPSSSWRELWGLPDKATRILSSSVRAFKPHRRGSLKVVDRKRTAFGRPFAERALNSSERY
mmetsp:Transcript_60882/g.137239  ORF Transcript_60882/g.137239 Transcript_60882/m.137239 type:complete len:563 (+) Transcript_60882:52-1740(+)